MTGPRADIAELVRELLSRAPEWIRVDLASRDSAARSRAEETLAAMIQAALDKEGISSRPDAMPNDAGERA